jgi:plastocyanin domain-containing protein
MKKLFLLIAVVLFCSCSNDDKDSSQNEIKGKWKLTNTSGGITGTSYPIPANQETVLEFSENTLKTYINGTLLNTQTYSFQIKKSIFGGVRKMIVTQSNSIANDINRVQSFNIVGDKLSLRDECFDCYTAEYTRINLAAF